MLGGQDTERPDFSQNYKWYFKQVACSNVCNLLLTIFHNPKCFSSDLYRSQKICFLKGYTCFLSILSYFKAFWLISIQPNHLQRCCSVQMLVFDPVLIYLICNLYRRTGKQLPLVNKVYTVQSKPSLDRLSFIAVEKTYLSPCRTFNWNLHINVTAPGWVSLSKHHYNFSFLLSLH